MINVIKKSNIRELIGKKRRREQRRFKILELRDLRRRRNRMELRKIRVRVIKRLKFRID